MFDWTLTQWETYLKEHANGYVGKTGHLLGVQYSNDLGRVPTLDLRVSERGLSTLLRYSRYDGQTWWPV